MHSKSLHEGFGIWSSQSNIMVAFYGVVPDGPGGTMATVTEYMVNGSLRHALQKKDK